MPEQNIPQSQERNLADLLTPSTQEINTNLQEALRPTLEELENIHNKIHTLNQARGLLGFFKKLKNNPETLQIRAEKLQREVKDITDVFTSLNNKEKKEVDQENEQEVLNKEMADFWESLFSNNLQLEAKKEYANFSDKDKKVLLSYIQSENIHTLINAGLLAKKGGFLEKINIYNSALFSVLLHIALLYGGKGGEEIHILEPTTIEAHGFVIVDKQATGPTNTDDTHEEGEDSYNQPSTSPDGLEGGAGNEEREISKEGIKELFAIPDEVKQLIEKDEKEKKFKKQKVDEKFIKERKEEREVFNSIEEKIKGTPQEVQQLFSTFSDKELQKIVPKFTPSNLLMIVEKVGLIQAKEILEHLTEDQKKSQFYSVKRILDGEAGKEKPESFSLTPKEHFGFDEYDNAILQKLTKEGFTDIADVKSLKDAMRKIDIDNAPKREKEVYAKIALLSQSYANLIKDYDQFQKDGVDHTPHPADLFNKAIEKAANFSFEDIENTPVKNYDISQSNPIYAIVSGQGECEARAQVAALILLENGWPNIQVEFNLQTVIYSDNKSMSHLSVKGQLTDKEGNRHHFSLDPDYEQAEQSNLTTNISEQTIDSFLNPSRSEQDPLPEGVSQLELKENRMDRKSFVINGKSINKRTEESSEGMRAASDGQILESGKHFYLPNNERIKPNLSMIADIEHEGIVYGFNKKIIGTTHPQFGEILQLYSQQPRKALNVLKLPDEHILDLFPPTEKMDEEEFIAFFGEVRIANNGTDEDREKLAKLAQKYLNSGVSNPLTEQIFHLSKKPAKTPPEILAKLVNEGSVTMTETEFLRYYQTLNNDPRFNEISRHLSLGKIQHPATMNILVSHAENNIVSLEQHIQGDPTQQGNKKILPSNKPTFTLNKKMLQATKHLTKKFTGIEDVHFSIPNNADTEKVVDTVGELKADSINLSGEFNDKEQNNLVMANYKAGDITVVKKRSNKKERPSSEELLQGGGSGKDKRYALPGYGESEKGVYRARNMTIELKNTNDLTELHLMRAESLHIHTNTLEELKDVVEKITKILNEHPTTKTYWLKNKITLYYTESDSTKVKKYKKSWTEDQKNLFDTFIP